MWPRPHWLQKLLQLKRESFGYKFVSLREWRRNTGKILWLDGFTQSFTEKVMTCKQRQAIAKRKTSPKAHNLLVLLLEELFEHLNSKFNLFQLKVSFKFLNSISGHYRCSFKPFLSKILLSYPILPYFTSSRWI